MALFNVKLELANVSKYLVLLFVTLFPPRHNLRVAKQVHARPLAAVYASFLYCMLFAMISANSLISMCLEVCYAVGPLDPWDLMLMLRAIAICELSWPRNIKPSRLLGQLQREDEEKGA